MKNNCDLTSKCINFLKLFFGIIIAFLILYFIIGEFIFPDERDVTVTDCHPFISDWEQILDNGQRIPAEVPGKVAADSGETVTLVTRLPNNLINGMNICFRTIWQDVEIYVDGTLRQSYSTKASRPFGTNSTARYVFVELKEADSGKELYYQFSSNSKYAGRTYPSYIGDRASIWIYLARAGALQTALSVLLLFLSTICIITCFILKLIYKKQVSLKYFAWTVFFVALWMLSESSFRQLIFKNLSVFSSYTYWCLMLISYPLLLYINDVQKEAYKKLYLLPAIYTTLIFIGGTLLQMLDIAQFVQMVSFVHIGNALTIVSIILTITIDTFRKRIGDYLFVGIGIYVFLLSALLEIVLYYLGSSLPIGTSMSFGLLFLFIMAIIKTGQDLFRAEQKKQNAVAARKAQTKFLANMSHEIRTPINVVAGMNELILRESQSETIQEYSRNIQSASNMLLGLISDVLDFSKIESGQLELVENQYSLPDLIRDITITLKTRVSKKPLSTHVDIAPDLPFLLQGDELRIKQILTNLISNAVKYTPSGSITLTVSSQYDGEAHCTLNFSVSDTGIGIKKEDLSKLFDSFKRLDLNKNRNIEGAGLGLNISKQLAELMNGSLTVESEYEKGSCFTLSIPQKILQKQPDSVPTSAVSDTGRKASSSVGLFTAPKASVLVVDDNTMNLTLMKGLLKRTEIQLDTATSGVQCLALTREKVYDLIFLDHMMPDMDGVETLNRLRADQCNPNQNATVIALTANAIAGCREMYLEYGFDDYFSKPIQADKLELLMIHFLPQNLVHLTKTDITNDDAQNLQ